MMFDEILLDDLDDELTEDEILIIDRVPLKNRSTCGE